MVTKIVNFRFNERELAIIDRFKDFVRNKHKGRYYGVFTNELINALNYYMRAYSEKNVTASKISVKKKKILEVEEKAKILKDILPDKIKKDLDYGYGVSRDIFLSYVRKVYKTVSKPTLYNKYEILKEILNLKEINNIVFDKLNSRAEAFALKRGN